MHRLFIIVFLFSVAVPQSGAAKPLATMKGHKNVVSDVAFARDGKLVASAAWDRMIRLWQIPSGKPAGVFAGHSDWVQALCFRADGTLISASDREIIVWQVAQKKVLKKVPLPSMQVTSRKFASGGRRFIVGTRDGRVWIWSDGKSKPEIRQVHSMAVTAVAIQARGRQFAAGSSRGQLKLGTIGQEKFTQLAGHEGAKIFVLAYSPDEAALASGCFDTTIKLWNTKSGQEKALLRGHKGIIMSLRYGNQGATLLSGDRHGFVHIWNLGSLKPQKSIAAHPGRLGFSVIGLDQSPNGKWLATGAYDHLVKLWPTK